MSLNAKFDAVLGKGSDDVCKPLSNMASKNIENLKRSNVKISHIPLHVLVNFKFKRA